MRARGSVRLEMLADITHDGNFDLVSCVLPASADPLEGVFVLSEANGLNREVDLGHALEHVDSAEAAGGAAFFIHVDLEVGDGVKGLLALVLPPTAWAD